MGSPIWKKLPAPQQTYVITIPLLNRKEKYRLSTLISNRRRYVCRGL
jgi:hypothetical protein